MDTAFAKKRPRTERALASETREADESLRVPANVVCGAGPVGLILAIVFRLIGEDVLLIEQRSEEMHAADEGTSTNLTLVLASIRFLANLGVDLTAVTVEILARQIWGKRGTISIHPYGLRKGDRLVSVRRRALLDILRVRALQLGVKFLYGTRLVGFDVRYGRALVEEHAGKTRVLVAPRWFFTDGANSHAREEFARQTDSNCHRSLDGFVYAVAQIPAEVAAAAGIVRDHIHFCAGPGCVDIAICNADGSAGLIMERPDNAGLLTIADDTDMALFLNGPPDHLRKHVPEITRQLSGSRLRRFKYAGTDTIAIGSAVLLGDSAHTFPAYLGQGLNAGIADVAVWTAAYLNTGDFSQANEAYQKSRQDHCVRLRQLSQQQGRKLLRGSFGSPLWKVQDRTARLAERMFGFRTLYQSVVFDITIPTLSIGAGRRSVSTLSWESKLIKRLGSWS